MHKTIFFFSLLVPSLSLQAATETEEAPMPAAVRPLPTPLWKESLSTWKTHLDTRGYLPHVDLIRTVEALEGHYIQAAAARAGALAAGVPSTPVKNPGWSLILEAGFRVGQRDLQAQYTLYRKIQRAFQSLVFPEDNSPTDPDKLLAALSLSNHRKLSGQKQHATQNGWVHKKKFPPRKTIPAFPGKKPHKG